MIARALATAAILALAGCGGAGSAGPSKTPHSPPSSAAPAAAPDCPDRAPKASAEPIDAEVLANAKVQRICFAGASPHVRELAAKAVTLAVGATLDAARIHDDLLAVLAIPEVADASVYATPVPKDAVTVVFVLEERARIADVSFDGVTAFPKGEIPATALAAGHPLDPAAVRGFVRAFMQAYKERGYGSANVAVSTEPAGTSLVRVRVAVVEGPLWHFGKIAARGNGKLTEKELLAAANLTTGATWDDSLVERAALLVQAAYYDKGMIESHVEVSQGEPTADGSVPVTFAVKEGDVFTLRSIDLAGLDPVESRQLSVLVTAKPKQVFKRNVLVEDIARMRLAARGVHPGMTLDIEPETKVDPKTKSVDIILRCTFKSH